MDRFALKKSRWYAAEIIGEEFGAEIRSYSPIRVDEITPRGNRRFEVQFYHANYPEGVRNKVYELQTLERSKNFVLARSSPHQPTRWLLIYAITAEWLNKHFGVAKDEVLDVETWLERNA
ncbi:hypothetical protein [Marinobacter sp. C2H3]|uniref:hypothetical protein n=1 Tax=Marinobacter sp. C2H3 TaxID=3119003 RepID=UPI00300E9158